MDRSSSASILKRDQRLDNAVALGIHHRERRGHLVERETVRGQGRRIDAVSLEQAQQSLEAQAAAGTERRADRLLGHSDAPRLARNADELAAAVIADVGDGTAGARRA